MKMFCCWWSFKPTVSLVVTMAIHTFVQWAFGFSYVLFVATAARDQIHNILCCAVCVLSQSYSGPRRWLHSASRGYHFAALTSFSATGSTFTSLVVIIRVWFESCSYQEITKAFGASESHDWFALVKYPSTHLMTRWWTNFCQQYPWPWVGQDDMSAQMGVLCRPLQTLACMTAEHLCSFAWLCQWQKLCPASDNHAGVADLSVLWLLIQTCLSQSKCVWGAVQDYMGYSCSSVKDGNWWVEDIGGYP